MTHAKLRQQGIDRSDLYAGVYRESLGAALNSLSILYWLAIPLY
jgi:hypothetical protein